MTKMSLELTAGQAMEKYLTAKDAIKRNQKSNFKTLSKQLNYPVRIHDTPRIIYWIRRTVHIFLYMQQ